MFFKMEATLKTHKVKLILTLILCYFHWNQHKFSILIFQDVAGAFRKTNDDFPEIKWALSREFNEIDPTNLS